MKKIRNLVLAGLLGVVGVFGVYSFDSQADNHQDARGGKCQGTYGDGWTGENVPCK
ncbi:hypothetical protein [Bacillus cereus group sp. BfR-BA-01445]|uniref:hypothetical protein n=1 Tax=Bacillus cereus group sp. BfR-BA-01445 TaxID=2920349 RepID=UPI001F57632C|nr:hypothetical protein [Bacillus cereus group sp. BfR-BA-01445]